MTRSASVWASRPCSEALRLVKGRAESAHAEANATHTQQHARGQQWGKAACDRGRACALREADTGGSQCYNTPGAGVALSLSWVLQAQEGGGVGRGIYPIKGNKVGKHGLNSW